MISDHQWRQDGPELALVWRGRKVGSIVAEGDRLLANRLAGTFFDNATYHDSLEAAQAYLVADIEARVASCLNDAAIEALRTGGLLA